MRIRRMERNHTPATRRRRGEPLALLGAAAALALAGALVEAPAASASSSLCNPGCSAAADFQSLGEKLVVHDYDSDGKGAIAFLYNNYESYTCKNTKGYDAPPVTCDYEFKEGSPVSYQVCNLVDGVAVNCSGWREDKA
ncbi:hypothetical protein [Streptomyces sp. MH60]|uniref:hypothetical protein n=1 Tax=Streptomyces sp. MH60 TaxID=1940758 RepID=UPI001057286D|nr:hypothetical protein [Streptomyces sp. MH60]